MSLHTNRSSIIHATHYHVWGQTYTTNSQWVFEKKTHFRGVRRSTMVICSPEAFRLLAKSITNTRSERGYKAKFGASPDVCCDLWERLQPTRPKKSLPKHLLWAMLFLKLYATEPVLSDMVGTTRKTFRHWSWRLVQSIQKLKPRVVSQSFQMLLTGD